MRTLLLAAWALISAAVSATSYSPISDVDLAGQASVIVQATVLVSEPAPTPSTPSTDTFVQVERVLKGFVAGSTVVVRVPGGVGPTGVGLEVWGAPSFIGGERVLLFLEPSNDGTYAILHLALGVFHEVRAGDRRLALRDLGSMAEIAPGGETVAGASDGGGVPIRDFESFAGWLFEIGQGSAESVASPGVDYLIRTEEQTALPSVATRGPVEESCSGLRYRWFEFDRDQKVRWMIDPRGFAGAGTGGPELDHARSVWRRAAGSRIKLGVAGETVSRRGLAAPDGINAVLFDDPGRWLPGSYSCPTGGLLAVSGIWFESGRDQDCRLVDEGRIGTHGGKTYLRILGADIVTNDGSGCFLSSGSMAAARVFTHELGHSLGLAESGRPDSLMQSRIRADTRPLVPDAGDLAELERLYRPRD